MPVEVESTETGWLDAGSAAYLLLARRDRQLPMPRIR